MSARHLVVRDERDSTLAAAAGHLRAGGLVAFPTETVYGLGADAARPAACERIYAVKGRPADNPLIVHFATVEAVFALLGEPGGPARALASRFWPGPLTMVLARPDGVLAGASAGLDSVAVRVPSHPLAHALIAEAGMPVAAPSANLSGRPSPTDAAGVLADLEEAAAAGRDVDDVWVIDGGAATYGVESTVIDVRGGAVQMLRQGALPLAAIEAVTGAVGVAADVRRSPGTRHRHYAPRAPLWLFGPVTPTAAVAAFVRSRPGPVALLAPPERALALQAALGPDRDRLRARPLGGHGDPEGRAAARDLFACLRWCDATRVAYALAELPDGEHGLWPAVRDRLERAAEGRWLERATGEAGDRS